MEKTVAEVRLQAVKMQRGAHGGIVIRVPKFTAKDLLADWNPWKQILGMSDIEEWLIGNIEIETKKVMVLADNGMGGDGACPFHRKQHLQIYPQDGSPMRCYEAMKMKEAE